MSDTNADPLRRVNATIFKQSDIDAAVLAERERCARIAEEHYADSRYHAFYINAGYGIAAAIRQGNTDAE